MTTWDRSLDDLRDRLALQGGRAAVLSQRTQRAYLKDARMLAVWLREHGVAAPERITPSALTAALRGLGWSAGTRARALTAAREWLAPHFPPGRSPAERVERPRAAPAPVPRLSQDDAREVMDAVRAPGDDRPLAVRDAAIVELLYGSGLRRQEVCDLTLAGLDFEHDTVRVVGKGGRARTVPLTEPAVRALRRWVLHARPLLVDPTGAATDHVFLSRSGRPLDGSSVYRIVAPVLRDMGRAGGPHLLRHAAATHLLEGPPGGEGAHLRVVQELLGHASLATTQRYTGVTTRDIQRQLRRGHPRG